MEFFDISVHKMLCTRGDFTADYKTNQVNGQLIATLKTSRRPKRGSEVFLKNIPRDALLQDILEFAIVCGDVYQIRLLMDFSGYNRGYCFLSYTQTKTARKAVATLNGNKIGSSPVVVKLSFDNNKLEMRGIPSGMDREEIFKVVSKIAGVGLKQVLTFRKTFNTRNVCVLKYDTHRNALEARKRFWPRLTLWNRVIEVDWAIPHEAVNSKRLYFRNLPCNVTKLQLYEEVTKYVKPETLLNMFLQDGLGYFLFSTEAEAKDALISLGDRKICDVSLELSFFRFVATRLDADLSPLKN